MSKLNNLLLLCALLLALAACNKKYDGSNSIDSVKYNKNTNSYPSTKIDSVQAINNITRQKLQELMDLAALYASGNKDTEIDSVIYAQMETYFLSPDSLKVTRLINQLDILQANYTKVTGLEIEQELRQNDTLNFARFNLEYYNADKKYLGKVDKRAQYVLKKSPVKFKQEFRFYFVDFDPKPKDSISSGNTNLSSGKSPVKTSEISSRGGK